MTFLSSLRRSARLSAALFGIAIATAAPLACAQAATSASYAVLSVIGDKMTVVAFRTPTASNLDRNERAEIPARQAFDRTALLVADDAIMAARPEARVILLQSNDPALFALQAESLGQSGAAEPAWETLRALLKQTGATRLLLVSKYRADARLRSRDSYIGTGKLAGIGFYLDELMEMTQYTTGESNQGFIAPYVYVTVSLLDTQQMRLIRRRDVMESQVVSLGNRGSATRAWEAMTTEAKVNSLQSLIRAAVSGAVPDVLAGE